MGSNPFTSPMGRGRQRMPMSCRVRGYAFTERDLKRSIPHPPLMLRMRGDLSPWERVDSARDVTPPSCRSHASHGREKSAGRAKRDSRVRG